MRHLSGEFYRRVASLGLAGVLSLSTIGFVSAENVQTTYRGPKLFASQLCERGSMVGFSSIPQLFRRDWNFYAYFRDGADINNRYVALGVQGEGMDEGVHPNKFRSGSNRPTEFDWTVGIRVAQPGITGVSEGQDVSFTIYDLEAKNPNEERILRETIQIQSC